MADPPLEDKSVPIREGQAIPDAELLNTKVAKAAKEYWNDWPLSQCLLALIRAIRGEVFPVPAEKSGRSIRKDSPRS